MRKIYKMTEAIHKYSEFYKKIILLLSCMFCIGAAIYINLYLKEDIVYTHLFYIPIILAAIWYGIKSLYLALFMGIFHIAINYIAFGAITISSFQRALLLMVVVLVGYLATHIRFGQLYHGIKPADAKSGSDNQLVNSRLQQINMVGQLGVAVGHEIRNPLTTVRGFLQLIDKEQNYEEARRYFPLMIEEIDKANASITHLINLADNKRTHREKQNLNKIVQECLSEYLPLKGHSNIKIKQLLSEIPEIFLDKGEINELLLNLLNNAVEAMTDGGTIIVSTVSLGDEVLLSVHDQGAGISGEVAKHVGKPFFTTKEASSGLGLAVCYSIASRHSARIEFVSTPNGTKFMIHFPMLSALSS